MARGKKRAPAKAKKVAAEPSVSVTDKKNEAADSKDAMWHNKLLGLESRKQSKQQAKIQLPNRQPISGAPTLFVKSLQILLKEWKLFTVILVIYALLHLLLVGGVTGGSSALSAVKSTFGHSGTRTTVTSQGLALFSTIVGSSTTSSTSGVYETFIFLIISIATIWALRQIYANNTIRARDAFYQGMYPLIQFILILLVIGVELLPLVFGVGLYSYLVGGGIAVGPFEVLAVLIVFFALLAASMYMMCSSIIALYIVTLPDMTPMEALKNARELVHYRRWIVLRKVLFLPLLLLLIATFVLIPIALFLAPLALIMLLLMSVLAVVVTHSYMYALYRELL